ncbi:hypothetical protein Echvi_3280 [Echinicola vietnamensis DSM 17526]|uniref:Uncharacterized protein n=1 Tax=Echinicola vietnamensis (strain DSM 17526 / LMG 23754 / KMM 6221) TaxID=926556 RepID=L0G022_ECHVK|nr:hypothetical protein Echvi_3280 [Echinicola vietnamensis DSM 17526]
MGFTHGYECAAPIGANFRGYIIHHTTDLQRLKHPICVYQRSSVAK